MKKLFLHLTGDRLNMKYVEKFFFALVFPPLLVWLFPVKI